MDGIADCCRIVGRREILRRVAIVKSVDSAREDGVSRSQSPTSTLKRRLLRYCVDALASRSVARTHFNEKFHVQREGCGSYSYFRRRDIRKDVSMTSLEADKRVRLERSARDEVERGADDAGDVRHTRRDVVVALALLTSVIKWWMDRIVGKDDSGFSGH